ncbi:hypothetical protein LTR95_002629 [Oleoguttula sp. CCFEE 5521]
MDDHTEVNGQVTAGRSDSPGPGLSEDVKGAYGLDEPSAKRDDGFVTESEDEDFRPDCNSDHSHASANKSAYYSRPFTPLTPTRPRLRRLRTGSPTRHSTNSPRSHRLTPRPNLDYPLVLLHVSLLPVSLPWSYASLRTLLPPRTWQNLQYLESKISATMLQRGLLIPHPEGEFEILVERLLKALELCDGRVTKCGHFRRPTRLSMDSDSGLGSSVSDYDGTDACDTCGETMEEVGSGSKAWTVRIFAANGLMGREAWCAAWREMESVDVEIVPRVDEETRRKLEERKREEAAEEIEREHDEEERIRELVEEQVLLAHERVKATSADAELRQCEPLNEPALGREPEPTDIRRHSDLPPIYRPKDIPLSILLRNYVYLLAQDWRNVAIACLALLVLVLAFTPGSVYTPKSTTAMVTVPESVHGVLGSMPDVSQAISRPASAAIDDVSSTIRPAGAMAFSHVREAYQSVTESEPDEQHGLTSPVYNLARLFEPHMCGMV